MSEVDGGGNFLAGIPTQALAQGMAGETGAAIFGRAIGDQERSEQLAVLIAKREAKIGRKPQLDRITEQIDKLELDHMTTANETKRKDLETQIKNLEARKNQIEKRAKKALAKDRVLNSMNLEASRINKINHLRSWAMGEVGDPSKKDLTDRWVREGDERAAFQARQIMGEAQKEHLTGSKFVTESYTQGAH